MNNIETKERSKTKMIITIIVAVIGALFVFAATKPDNFHIERSITINATPDRVFELVNDFHAWNLWSPWEKKDPDMKRTYSGATTGIAAVYAWEGNNSVGTGEMEIIASVPFSNIQIALRFAKPFNANNTADFIFNPNGGATQVSWSMRGENTFMGKVMQIFMSMEKMIGPDFELGLIQLKAAAENNPNS